MQKEIIKVLLIEDDEDDYLLTRELLADISADKYSLDWISQFDAGLAALRRNEHDICLLDYRLGAHTGLDVLRALGNEINSVPPVIMLTGMGNRDLDMETMLLGASDYLAKSALTGQSLERSIRYGMQHRAAYQDLQASRNLNRSILASMHTLIVVLNADGVVLSSNLDAPQFQDKISCPLQDIARGMDFLKMYQQKMETDAPLIQDFLVGLQRVMNGDDTDYAIEFACGTGIRQQWFFAAVTPLVDGSGGAVITFTDVSSRVWAAEEITRLNEELEARVQQRTRQLARANQRLTILDRLKTKFVADVSHELRTPITNLKLYISLMKRGVPDKRNHYISVIDDQINRLTALVENTLILSRLETGDDPVHAEPVDLISLLQGKVASRQEEARAKGLVLEMDPVEDLPVFWADVDKIAMLVRHLLENALSYTDSGTIRLRVYAIREDRFNHAVDDPADEMADDMTDEMAGDPSNGPSDKWSTHAHAPRPGLCIEVSDTGTGIAEEDLPHIFERFYRSFGDQQGDIAGTGLGLSIVQTIVHLHGGHIAVRSHLKVGSTFQIWLPTQPPSVESA